MFTDNVDVKQLSVKVLKLIYVDMYRIQSRPVQGGESTHLKESHRGIICE